MPNAENDLHKPVAIQQIGEDNVSACLRQFTSSAAARGDSHNPGAAVVPGLHVGGRVADDDS
jgi:hypothetical protein